MLPFPSKSSQNEALRSSDLNSDLKLWSCGLFASGAKGLWSWSVLKPTHSFTTIQFVVTEGGITNGELNPIIPSYKLFYSMLIKWLPAWRFSHRSVTWISRFEQIRLSLQEMELVRHYSQGQRQKQSLCPLWSSLNFLMLVAPSRCTRVHNHYLLIVQCESMKECSYV